MNRSVAIKLLLVLAVGASAIVPAQRLLERRRSSPFPPSTATAAEPSMEKAPLEPPAAAQAGPTDPADATAAAIPAVTPIAPAETKRAAPGTKADAVTAPPPLAAGRRTYVVKEGDSLWSIAEKEMGNGKWTNRILEANRGLMDPSSLRVGQVIVIPDANADAPRHR